MWRIKNKFVGISNLSSYFSFLILFFTLEISNLHAQSGWFWQNPLPQGNHLYAVQAVSPGVFFAVGTGGALLKSTNGGLNWSGTYFLGGFDYNGAPFTISCFHFVNNNTGVILTNGYYNRILRTVDGGLNWDTTSGITNASFKTVFFVDEYTGWCCASNDFSGYNSIMKTTDGGQNWFSLSSPFGPIYGSYFINANTGWLVGWYHCPTTCASFFIHKTTDGGSNWVTQLNVPQSEVLKTVFFVNSSTGWAGGTRLWKTTDGGNSWNPKNISANSLSFINASTGYGLNGSSIIKTTDAGNSWITQSSFGGNSIAAADANNVVSVGNYGDMGMTSNGGINWVLTSRTVAPFYLNRVYFANNISGFVYGGGVLLKTTDAGSNWNTINNFSNSLGGIFFTDINTGWIVGTYGFIRKTTNGGTNWTTQTSNTTRTLGAPFFLNENIGWISGGDTMLVTSNSGINWMSIRIPGPYLNSMGSALFFQDINTGVGGGLGGIGRTTDGGFNWQRVFSTGIEDISKDNQNNLYAITLSAVYKSSDFGLNWQLISNPSPTGIVSIMMINSNTGYVAGIRGLILKTTNGGVNWSRQNSKYWSGFSSIFFTDVNSGWVVGDAGAILSTVDGGGNFVIITNYEEKFPKDFSLNQNYPNPFNPTTTIKYAIINDIKVAIKVYDVLGKEVKTLINEFEKAGYHEVMFDGTNMATGIYFYRLEAGEFVETKKMVLVK